ncbi:MAG TPA: TolC family protein, partial [Thermoanaerobaculia bacterium]
MTVVRRTFSILLLSLMATGLVAQTQTTTTTEAPRAAEPVTAPTDQDVNDPRAMRLTLDGAVRTAMERNLGIQLQTYEYQIAGESLRATYGVFDWIATADLGVDRNESVGAAAGENTRFANFGVGQFIPTGGQYSLGFQNSKTRSRLNGLDPAFGSGLTFSFDQPLLRNFGMDINRRGITIARNTLGVSRETFRTQLMDTANNVTQAYLDLVYARRAVDVVKESLFLARDQARITQIRIDVGASAPLDILQPRVRIASVEETLIRSVAAVRDAEDRLRALLNLAPSEWDRPIIPTDPVDYAPMTIDTEAAVQRAFEQRPETRQQNLFIDTARTEYLYARNQRLPEVNLGLGYSAAGLAGREIERDANGVPTGRINSSTNFTRAFRDVLANDTASWDVGVSVAIPITNIGARAQFRRAELDLEQTRLTLDQIRQDIAVQVRAFARAVDTAARAISATRTSREAAERNLEA